MRVVAVAEMPARVGPTMLTPGATEWQAAHPGGVALYAARPCSTGSCETACPGGTPSAVATPGTALPRTRIGRGGHPCVSMRLIHPRNAMTSSISWSVISVSYTHLTLPTSDLV